MRAKFLSGMLYFSFRRARSSVQPVRHAARFEFSTTAEKVPVTQRMEFARRYANLKDLVCPIKYFKEEFSFLDSLDGNELLASFGIKGKSEVSRRVAKAVRSLASIILDNHALGIACGDSLRLSNLRISRSLGEFAMMEPPKKKSSENGLLGDFARGADVLEEIATQVLEPGVVMPEVWRDFIKKMRDKFPSVELIMYHSLFLPLSLRYWLLVTVDQRFRKDFDSLTKDEKVAIRKFLKDLGKNRKEDLEDLVSNNEFVKFISLRSRSGNKARMKGKLNSDLSTPEAIWSNKARDIIAYCRDSPVHGCKGDLKKNEKDAMPNIKHYWRTQKNIIQLLSVLFEGIEQSYIDLCFDENKLLWKLLGMPEMFGETEETWKAALDAINAEIETVKYGSYRLGKEVASEDQDD